MQNLINETTYRILTEITSDERAQLEDDFESNEGNEFSRILEEGFRLFRELEDKYEPNVLKYLASCINLKYGKFNSFNF